MKTWRVAAGSGIEGLKSLAEPPAQLAPTGVRVRLRAATLNYRDLMVLKGWYPVSGTGPLVPGSDGAGDVIETGAAVTRFKVGDRVTTCFFPDWVEGRMSLPKIGTALGAGIAGTLGEQIVLDERSLVTTPAHLDYAQGAALTCAGTTAWNALFEAGSLKPGQWVLLLGTGGVSIWALQLARAAGARVIITSSSDEKLERARAMGAEGLINYSKNPEWSGEVRKITGGEGVDVVLEVGGEKTAQQSLASVRMQGTVVIIGGVSGFGGAINPRSLIVGATRVQGVYVGSRQMHEELARFVASAKIKPVVDKVFAYDAAPEAYRHFEAGRHFGKVAVDLS
jgi:NADPH:quinone reductase-like Zn-dependent oxidoreductase